MRVVFKLSLGWNTNRNFSVPFNEKRFISIDVPQYEIRFTVVNEYIDDENITAAQ